MHDLRVQVLAPEVDHRKAELKRHERRQVPGHYESVTGQDSRQRDFLSVRGGLRLPHVLRRQHAGIYQSLGERELARASGWIERDLRLITVA